ncbi:acetylglutamate kinase [Herpetosiphon giganteus]|uniref:acetylglutamate kinase n=1 Tax=Herpetosiphon giganteus TaxID=2029754 RepID=UPI00195843C0|nr:acetylglutamate kinase [Herpetosiphon giganteus]MBM7844173.1 acetylglutamate kinase [Herpetosiphon giganteus]
MRILKLGGNEIDDPTWLARLVAVIQTMVNAHDVPILVHGGGKEIGQLQVALGGEPQFVAGLRVTDQTALKAATMVLCGSVSTRLVAALNAVGVEALGLSGIDRNLVYATRVEHEAGDLGAVGKPARIRATILYEALAADVVPVLAPICADGAGGTLNVNADVFAGAIAAAVGADEAVFISNVPGVLVDGVVAPRLNTNEIQALIANGTISGGMIPKVESALSGLQAGVKVVRITNIDQLEAGTIIEAA